MVVTPDLKSKILALEAKGIKGPDIAKKLNLKRNTVYNHLSTGKTRLKNEDQSRKSKWVRKKNQAAPGCFNEHERENWLV